MPTIKVDDHITMIELQPHGIRGFLSTYLVSGEETALIDPGPSSGIDILVEELGKLGVDTGDIRYIMATHIHIDHAGGAGKLLKKMPNASILVHSKGARHMVDPTRLWEGALNALGELAALYERVEGALEERVKVLTEGMTVDLGGGVKLGVLETPGHASHCLSFYDERSQGIFTGDAAGLYLKPPGAVFPTTPQPFFLDSALESVDKMIAKRPKKIYYAHLGYADDGLSKLERYKQQLNLWFNVVAEAAGKGESTQEIYKKLVERNEMVKMARKDLESNPMFKENLLLSIEGMLGYLHRISS